MIALRPDEKILLVLRRHWYVMAGPSIGIVLACILPSALLITLVSRFPLLSAPEFGPIIKFFLSLYLAAVLLYLLLAWSNYYLDVWVITSERLIDINQRGLFYREISEMNMENIQNVTINISGFMATLLRFGDLKVETAGENDFVIRSVPGFYEAKDLLLKYSNMKHAAKSSVLPNGADRPQ